MPELGSDRAKQLILPKLHEKKQREKSVLIFYGTGVNAWHYYPFLRQFSLQDLQDFRAIYGISGGAVCLWYYGLSFLGLFDSKRISRFDGELRSLNEKIIFLRLFQFIANRYVYDTSRLARQIESFACPEASAIQFAEYPLSNFTAIGYDDVNKCPLFLNAKSHPRLPMGDVMASLAFPRQIFGRKLCSPIFYSGFSISDIDFAGRGIRSGVIAELKRRHVQDDIYICNIFFGKREGNIAYIDCGHDRFPRLGQLFDLALFLLNIPNRRIEQASM